MKNIPISLFREMIFAGTKSIAEEYTYINELNIFPVPDGDTGSNMKTTTSGALEYISDESLNYANFSSAYAKGLLMNARGNSGVIFSQIFRGFLDALNVDSDILEIKDFQQGLILAAKKAYDSVSNPVEGTMLTVIRVLSEKIPPMEFNNINDFFQKIVEVASDVVSQTTEMLDSLKEANVVDSGAYGLLTFLKGMLSVLDHNAIINTEKKWEAYKQKNVKKTDFVTQHDETESFGYCSEIVMNLNHKIIPDAPNKKVFNLSNYKSELEQIGDSLVLVQDDNYVKVHIHTLTPHKLLQISQKYGEFDKIKIDNMTNQFYETLKQKGIALEKKKIPDFVHDQQIIVSVPSAKFKTLFVTDYGLEHILVTEDQNIPSIQDYVDLILKTESKNVFIVTDDPNYIMAADHAAKIAAEQNINCFIIPGKNVFEALIAISLFDERNNAAKNSKDMIKGIKKAISAKISRSIKNVNFENLRVNKNDYIGIINKKIVSASNDSLKNLKQTIQVLIDLKKHPEICYIYAGKNAKASDIEQINEHLSMHHNILCEVIHTEQKLYDYYIGIQ
ncbi:DAK2 domain-containing protein [Ureaplasma zalophigenitalium]|uniref:DAK2 domain-containing protein n=1 Tax=Ureaplasma zalophigenitalium TaxID=907723 RepID=A0ABT3BNJ8_9BACT|nr:DAK2 domain-containing protein [Ureaplasma zalophigenitalium]MCV3753824.1 DAK2 domain-containing protein [Ureaplasma zalophigenitalium]